MLQTRPAQRKKKKNLFDLFSRYGLYTVEKLQPSSLNARFFQSFSLCLLIGASRGAVRNEEGEVTGNQISLSFNFVNDWSLTTVLTKLAGRIPANRRHAMLRGTLRARLVFNSDSHILLAKISKKNRK